MSRLALFLLGPPRIELDGKPVQISRRKVVALLAYLAVTGTPHSRDALATLLWPERSQSRARAYLRRALSELNRTMGEGVLTIDRETAALEPGANISLDVDVFRQQLAAGDTHDHPTTAVCSDCVTSLEEAVELYSDDFMAGFTLRDSPDFDEWQFFERESLRDELAGTLERLVHWHSSQSEYEYAIGFGRRWLALDPLHEPVHRHLMELYAQSGQRAAARRQYQECVRILKDELGAPPSAETKALYERITAGEPEILKPPIRTVRGYELRERIGSGGFGEVYRAYQPAVARDVAVKVILPQYTDHPEFVRRFETEAQFVARLEHPHIVPLYDYWRDSEGAYLVMRWLRGGNLHQALQRGPWSPEAAMRLLDQIADALAVAHRQGVVHRDIKPENILLDEEGNAYLSDFGIAKDLAHAAAVTDPDAVPGSLWYISPEQAKSEPVTPQSDVYSLGIVMYEVLIGQHPFSGSTPPDQLIKRLTEPLPPLRVRRTDLPAALDLVIQRATASDLAERYPDALAFARKFRETLSRMEVVVPAPSPARIHNLPAQATPFVGREAELAEIGKLLSDPDCRLLTLVGPGGSGKTRLALEAAAAQLDANAYRDGIFFVALAALQSTAGIESAVAEAIGFSFLALDRQSSVTERKPRRQLLDYLHRKQMLIVMDNFEHLLDGVDLATKILETAPEVKILATSRERLNVGGEHRYQISGMDFPKAPCTVGEAMQYSAIRLFVQGARRAQRGFQFTEGNLEGVIQICLLTDGMPLAVRLAAAWSALLTPSDIAFQLSHGLDLLETKRRDVPARQRSLRAAFEHSWNLLTQREREVFQALSVFRGGFTREAAQVVSGASLLELLAMADKSLLDRDSATRFQIHRSLQQFAADKLERDPATWETVRDRHCAFFSSALQSWEAGLKDHRQGETLGEMDQEIENARAAWEWAAEHRQVERLDRALDALAIYFESRCRWRDGEDACRLAAGALGDETPTGGTADADALRVLARLLTTQARFCWHMGDTPAADRLLDQSLALLRNQALSDRDTQREQALIAFQQALTTWGLDWEQCRRHFERGLGLYRATGDQWWEARILEQLGWMGTYLAVYDDAARWLQESLTIRRNIGDRAGVASCLNASGSVVYLSGGFEEAINLNRECIQISRELGHWEGIGRGLNQLGPGLTLMGQFTESLSVLAESAALWTGLGVHKFETWHAFWRGMAEMHLGRYQVAGSLAEQVLTRARGSRHRASIASAFWLLGDTALAVEEPARARECLAQSIATYREYDALSNEMTIVLGEMALAMVHLGQASEAAQMLLEALQIIRKGGAIASFIHVLPAGALFEAASGAPELAAEYYALASRYPLVTNSCWYEDVVGKHIAAAASTLPPEVVAAAQERGQARDLWATAEELLTELDAGIQQ